MLAAPLTNTIWISFLAQLTDSDDRVGLSINPTPTNSSVRDGDFILVGTGSGGEMRARVGPSLNSFTVATNLIQDGTSTYLVLVQIIVNGDGVQDALSRKGGRTGSFSWRTQRDTMATPCRSPGKHACGTRGPVHVEERTFGSGTQVQSASRSAGE